MNIKQYKRDLRSEKVWSFIERHDFAFAVLGSVLLYVVVFIILYNKY